MTEKKAPPVPGTPIPQAMGGENLTVSLIFGLMYLLCLIPLYFYSLNEKRAAEIIEGLRAKQAGEHGKPSIKKQTDI